MSTSDFIALCAIIVAILIPLFIWAWRKYFVRPELTIELRPNGGNSSPQGYSHKNIPVDGVIDMRTALQIFRMQWNYNIIIRNNSESTAYYPTIYFRQSQPQFYKLEKLNPQESISSTAQIIIKAEYAEFEECTGARRTQIGKYPPAFENFQILLEYQNGAKHHFYSLYDHSDQSTKFSHRKLKGFD